MSIVSLRVPRDLKEKMSKVKEDWASYLRLMIEQRIRKDQIVGASATIDRIRWKTKRGEYSAIRSIREDRDRA